MNINIEDLLKNEGSSLEIDYKGSVEGLESTVDSYTFKGPISFKGSLQNNKGKLHLTGLVSLEYSSPCFRCLEDVHGSAEIPVKEDILHVDKVTDKDDVFTYEGDYLNLDKILLDYIILNLPMKQLCKEDCKGLCPVCGTNLNEATCNCEEEKEINPKFDILRKFFE
ncbi:MAG TPA: DUF177 domain-containing protein [Clostridiaceae bacterium]|nr:DUF177 domain-containing protein [Clostridiaceae bacterium]